jgi:hypothetical protein
MKQGMTLTELAGELQRQQEVKRDFIVDTRQAEVTVGGAVVDDDSKLMDELLQRPVKSASTDEAVAGQLNLSMETPKGIELFPIDDHALGQIGNRLGIPRKYVTRLAADHPDMLAWNVNELFKREPENRLVRTLDGNARAFLSDRYRMMDNFDLAQAVLPSLIKFGAKVTSCNVTANKMYIKAVREDMKREVGPPPGHEMGDGTHRFFIDTIQAGLMISNSEIGSGKMAVQPASFTEKCTNYAVFESTNYGRVHLGRKQGGDMEQVAWEVFSDATKQKSDEALFSQVRDLVEASMDGSILDKIHENLLKARGQKIEAKVPKVMELAQKQFGLNDEETGGVLEHLIAGGELTKYGLSNAVTRMSQDVEDYDRATDLEALGGRIIELPQRDWNVITKAA